MTTSPGMLSSIVPSDLSADAGDDDYEEDEGLDDGEGDATSKHATESTPDEAHAAQAQATSVVSQATASSQPSQASTYVGDEGPRLRPPPALSSPEEGSSSLAQRADTLRPGFATMVGHATGQPESAPTAMRVASSDATSAGLTGTGRPTSISPYEAAEAEDSEWDTDTLPPKAGSRSRILWIGGLLGVVIGAALVFRMIPGDEARRSRPRTGP